MPGWGTQPGERETEHVSIATRVKMPWLRFVYTCAAEGAATMAFTLILYIILATVAGFIAANREPIPFHLVVWRGMLGGWRGIRWFLSVPAIMWLALVIFHASELVTANYRPHQITGDSWPATNAAQEPHFAAETFAQAQERYRRLLEADAPEPTAERVIRIELAESTRNGRRVQIAHLPDLDGLPAFARAVVAGQSLSFRTAQRFGITRAQFNALRQELFERGWAVWADRNNPRQGIRLTHAGRAVMRHIAHSPAPQSVVSRVQGAGEDTHSTRTAQSTSI